MFLFFRYRTDEINTFNNDNPDSGNYEKSALETKGGFRYDEHPN